jgi:hypothetical protein
MARQQFIELTETLLRELSYFSTLIDQHIGCEHPRTPSVGDHSKTRSFGSWLFTKYFGHVEEVCDRVDAQNAYPA